MAIKTRAELKAYFEENDIPVEEEFWDVLDSVWLKTESIPVQKITIGEVELECDATTVWDMSNGLNAFLHIDQNTTFDIQNMENGQHATVIVVQDATGGRTITLPAGHKVGYDGQGVIELSTTPNTEDTLSVYKSELGYYWLVNKTFTAA